MKQDSRHSFPVRKQQAAGSRQESIALLTAYCILLTGLTGCSEALQKKFIRKKKTPQERPSPVVTFRNYMEGITPLERYRKHYAMFAYWNDQLITELQQPRDMNPKRVRHASQEALQELRALGALLREDAATELQPFLEHRTHVNRQLHGGVTTGNQLASVVRDLEAQTRQLHRRFDWRRVQDRLKAQDARAD